MSRIVDSPIDVTLDPDGAGGLAPTAFKYRGERHQVVEVIDTWLMTARPWWEDPNATAKGPEELRFWRVRTAKGGVFELTQQDKAWRLYKVYD